MKFAARKIYALAALSLTLFSGCFITHRTECAKSDDIVSENDASFKKEGFTSVYFSGSYYNTIRHISKGYITQDQAISTLPCARYFIVEKVEAFTKPFNEEKSIRIYLQDYPFSAKNISLQFQFLDQSSRPLTYPNFAQISALQGQVNYFYWDEETNSPHLAFSERYDQALNSYNKSKLFNWKPKPKLNP